MTFLYLFLLGIAILVGAILLNLFASQLGLVGWYEFLKDRNNASLASYAWLFLIYPLGLGSIAYFASRLLERVLNIS